MQLNLYGLLIALGILIATVLCIREEKLQVLPKDTGFDIILYTIPLGVIGARLYYVIFAWEQFRSHPLSVLYIWQGGLAIYGGIIGGVLGLWLLSQRRKIPLWRLTDVAVPGLLLGQAIGRWGNYFNQEAHGRAVLDKSLQFFPVAVKVDATWFYATFFYESVWNFLGFAFLYANRKRFRVKGNHGDVTLWYFVWYALGRMVIEMLRTDSLMLGNMRVSQGLSILLFLVGVLLLSKRSQLAVKYYLLLLAGLITVVFAAISECLWCLILGAIVLAFYAALLYQTYRTGEIHATTAV